MNKTIDQFKFHNDEGIKSLKNLLTKSYKTTSTLVKFKKTYVNSWSEKKDDLTLYPVFFKDTSTKETYLIIDVVNIDSKLFLLAELKFLKTKLSKSAVYKLGTINASDVDSPDNIDAIHTLLNSGEKLIDNIKNLKNEIIFFYPIPDRDPKVLESKDLWDRYKNSSEGPIIGFAKAISPIEKTTQIAEIEVLISGKFTTTKKIFVSNSFLPRLKIGSLIGSEFAKQSNWPTDVTGPLIHKLFNFKGTTVPVPGSIKGIAVDFSNWKETTPTPIPTPTPTPIPKPSAPSITPSKQANISILMDLEKIRTLKKKLQYKRELTRTDALELIGAHIFEPMEINETIDEAMRRLEVRKNELQKSFI